MPKFSPAEKTDEAREEMRYRVHVWGERAGWTVTKQRQYAILEEIAADYEGYAAGRFTDEDKANELKRELSMRSHVWGDRIHWTAQRKRRFEIMQEMESEYRAKCPQQEDLFGVTQ